MNKKLSLIIVLIGVILIAVGAYLILSNPTDVGDVSGDSFKVPLKTHDFKLFKMDVPEGSKFTVKNEADGMKYYKNTGKYAGNISGIIINKGLTDSLIGDNSIPISNSTKEKVYSFQLKNKTNYKYVCNQGDVDIILIGNDLNLLKEVSDTVKIKDIDGL